MSANGEQAAAHKQQQATTAAPSQPPPPGPDHINPPAFIQLAPHPGPYALPPGAFSPVFFGHSNTEGMVNHGDPNVPQYMPYTQMMYVYPPPIPGQGNQFGCLLLDFSPDPRAQHPHSPIQGLLNPASSANQNESKSRWLYVSVLNSTAPVLLSRPVWVQCTNCASACKKCDDGRPCQRCTRSNLVSTCKDGVRKERKRGIKRGPYKRRNKPPSDDEAEIPRGQFRYIPALRCLLTQISFRTSTPNATCCP